MREEVGAGLFPSRGSWGNVELRWMKVREMRGEVGRDRRI